MIRIFEFRVKPDTVSAITAHVVHTVILVMIQVYRTVVFRAAS